MNTHQPDAPGMRALYQAYRTTRARVELIDDDVLKRLFAELDLPGAAEGHVDSAHQLLVALIVRDCVGGRVVRMAPTDMHADEFRRRDQDTAKETGEPPFYANMAPDLSLFLIAVPHRMPRVKHNVTQLLTDGPPPSVATAYLALRRRVVEILRREAQPN